MMTNDPTGRQVVDISAVAAAGFTVLDLLPAIAALFSIIWLAMRIFEAVTGVLISETRLSIWLVGLFTRKPRKEE